MNAYNVRLTVYLMHNYYSVHHKQIIDDWEGFPAWRISSLPYTRDLLEGDLCYILDKTLLFLATHCRDDVHC